MTITRIQAVDRGWGYKPEQISLLVAADDSEAPRILSASNHPRAVSTVSATE